METVYRDRRDAGKRLAELLSAYAQRPDVLVLALPRGGVPVAYEVARALNAPLDVFLVRKLGVPGHEEAAMGAIASGGIRVLNDEVIRALRIPEQVVEQVAAREQRELERRERLYRGPASNYLVRLTRSSARGRLSRSLVSGGGTRISSRLPIKKSTNCLLRLPRSAKSSSFRVAA